MVATVAFRILDQVAPLVDNVGQLKSLARHSVEIFVRDLEDSGRGVFVLGGNKGTVAIDVQSLARRCVGLVRNRHQLAVDFGLVRHRNHFDRIDLTLFVYNGLLYDITLGVGHVANRDFGTGNLCRVRVQNAGAVNRGSRSIRVQFVKRNRLLCNSRKGVVSLLRYRHLLGEVDLFKLQGVPGFTHDRVVIRNIHIDTAYGILHIHIRVTSCRLFHNGIDVTCEVSFATGINRHLRRDIAKVSNKAILGAAFKAVHIAGFLTDLVVARIKNRV